MEEQEQIAELVKHDDEWIEYIKGDNVPLPHKMFTDQSYFDSFWQHAEHGIILCAHDGKILSANSYMRDMLHAQLSELQGENIFNLISERFLKQDYTNISAIIKSTIYSYSTDNEMKEPKNPSNLIPVHIVATRVPSSVKHPFRHLIIHIYEMKGVVFYDRMPNSLKDSTDWKSIVKQPWFLKWCFALVALIIILTSISGQLFPLIQKALEKF